MNTCFVCMPLVPEFLDIYNAIAHEVADTLGGKWHCIKADDTRRPGMVTEKVALDLLNSDLIVAIVHDPRGDNSINPNVMYELGVAHSFRKPTVVVADCVDGLPFDIKDVETIELDFSLFREEETRSEFLTELRRQLQISLKDSRVHEVLAGKLTPGNPITTQLSRARIFIEDLPWVWGYREVLKREREAESVWEITRDLFWPQEALFFEGMKEAVRRKRKHYFMVENHEGVLGKMSAIRNQLQREFPKNEIERLVHFVAIDPKYFVLWPIAVVLYDADMATRKGGIICEPMQSQVGHDEFDIRIRELFVQHARSGDLEGFQRILAELPWTERRREATFDIALDVRVVEMLAASFAQIWNERILEEAQQKSGDEKSMLLNNWLIGG